MNAILDYSYRSLYESNRRYSFVFWLGLSVALFLNIFQPFGINNGGFCLKGILLVSGYGLITSIGLLILIYSEKVTKKIYNVHPLLFFGASLFLISTLAFTYFSFAFSNAEINDSFYQFLINTTIVGIVVLLLFKGLFFSEQSKSENTHRTICIPSRNKSATGIKLLPSSIVMIEANGNYIMIYYLHENVLKKKLIRNTLKEAEVICSKYDHLVRCHFSFIVNTEYIMELIKYNKRHVLSLTLSDKLIPISQKHYSTLKSQIS